MKTTSHERAILPLVALQGAIGTLPGFICFFIMRTRDMNTLFSFTALMLTTAVVSTFLAYRFGPRLHMTGKRLFKLGFLIPGLLMLWGQDSVITLALAYGSFTGLTWGARHWLEMNLITDGERDSYAAHSGTLTVAFGMMATFVATLALAHFAQDDRLVYFLYGGFCLAGAFLLGNQVPDTKPVSIRQPMAVIRQPEFLACLPLFFLESGLFGVSQVLASAGAEKALHDASDFGWVATVAALSGGLALYMTRRHRDVDNRSRWLGASCLTVSVSFIMLGLSAWVPALFVVHSILKSAGGPFLSASEQVLNQRTLDIRGSLADRIFAREFVLWTLRMISLCIFWLLANMLSPLHILAVGSMLLASATGMEYVFGKNLLWKTNLSLQQPKANAA